MIKEKYGFESREDYLGLIEKIEGENGGEYIRDMIDFFFAAVKKGDAPALAYCERMAERGAQLIAALANQLNALFGPCGLVSIMAVCVGVAGCKSKLMKLGIYFFAAMEWICNVGYHLFPWVSGAPASNPQNIMHLAVTVLVVVFSLASLVV